MRVIKKNNKPQFNRVMLDIVVILFCIFVLLAKHVYESNKKKEKYRELYHHSYVDLGLPSKILWAKYNTGAIDTTEEGDQYNLEVAPTYDADGSYISNHKDVYDVWSKEWRLPSLQNWEELINGCTWQVKKMEGRNSSVGMVGISKYNGKTIYFPAYFETAYWSEPQYGCDSFYCVSFDGDSIRFKLEIRVQKLNIRMVK